MNPTTIDVPWPSGGASASEPAGDGVWGRSPHGIKAKSLQES